MVMEAAGAMAGAAMGLLMGEKAKLECTGDNMPDGEVSLDCMFNPTEYTLSQTTEVKRTNTPAKVGGTAEYNGTGALKFGTALFFDEFSAIAGDVTPKISTLLSWTRPTAKSLADKKPAPPLVKFVWGGNPELATFRGYLVSVDVTYSLFRKDGTPVRATAKISIEGEKEEAGAQNPTSHATNSRHVHTVIEGDTLASIAHRELGKPRYWRAIAELNGIDDPMRLAPGSVLLIPSLADAARSA